MMHYTRGERKQRFKVERGLKRPFFGLLTPQMEAELRPRDQAPPG